ncbi:MAG: L-threonylcarbamoyladenylate synthase [Pseudomonadota bacterium]
MIKTASKETITEAAELIQKGEIVALPTETVYGLGANALDGKAVAKIFAAKNRPSFNPLIVHVASVEQAQELAVMNGQALNIVREFWPGPLTLILPKKQRSNLSDLVSAGLETIAIRMPNHSIALDLIKKSGVPIAAPSANSSGEPSATTAHHVKQSLGKNVPFILDAGACNVGLESTVLDLTSDYPVILRPGAVTASDLKPYLGEVDYDFGAHDKPQEKIKSPGQLLKHYAPSIPVRLQAIDAKKDEALLAFGQFKNSSTLEEYAYRNLSEESDLQEAAANLFKMLRDLDDPRNSGIAVMDIPNEGLGIAINERLSRAAKGR